MSCLRSQEMRKLAPELDPLRIGTGWKPEDLSKPQIFIESTFGDSHPGSGHLEWKKSEKVWQRPEDTAPDISAQTCATEKARVQTALISAWSAVK